MVVCKFYLQGRCHFGDRCNFEHPRDGNQQQAQWGSTGSFTSPNPFAKLQSNPTVKSSGKTVVIANLAPNQILDVIAQDMTAWENGKMWPFSCYAYAKEVNNIPGFEDFSPEEIRLEAYESRKSNSFSAHEQKMSELSKKYSEQRILLKKPSGQIREQLLLEIQKNKQNTAASSGVAATHKAGTAGLNGSSSVFGGGGGTSSVFGSQSTSGGSVFGSQSTSTASVFGSGSSVTSTSSVFGGSSTNTSAGSVFGGSSATSSVFGGSAGTAGSASVFGGAANSSSTGIASSVFGQAASPIQPAKSAFGSAATSLSSGSSAFGSSSTTGGSGGFGSAGTSQLTPSKFSTPAATSQPSSVFGTSNTPTSSSNTTGVFGSQPNTGSVFGQPATLGGTLPAVGNSGSGSVFGGRSGIGENVFGGSTSAGGSVFGQSTTGSSTGIFGDAAASAAAGGSVFGQSAAAATTSSSLSAQSESTSATGNFGSQAGGSSMFNTAKNNVSASRNLFGGGTSTDSTSAANSNKLTSAFGSVSNTSAFSTTPAAPSNGEQEHPNAYTLLSELTLEEKAAFEADEFELGKIPMRPPPKELCF